VNDFASEMQICLAGENPLRIGVAISGGSDSTALLVKMANWAVGRGITVFAATVDHGLRPEAASEAQQVAGLCATLGIAHMILPWRGWDGRGNLQDQARQARHLLLSDWAHSAEIETIALGHSLNDQAETVMLRLMRGSGVDGLAGMASGVTRSNIRWIRPLLGTSRQDIRDELTDQGIAWSDDPSNQDIGFERIKVRKLMRELDISNTGLAETAGRMQRAREALEIETHQTASAIAEVTLAGDVEFDRVKFFETPEEIRQRLLAHALKWVASNAYRPRLDGLLRVMKSLVAGNKATLAGCVCEITKSGKIRVSREPASVSGVNCQITEIWDGRWAIYSKDSQPELSIAALTENGLAHCPDWRATGLSRSSLLSSPAIWRDKELIAAPAAGLANGWTAELTQGSAHFFTSILTH